MRVIRWNKLARLDYFKNIDYLLENWSEKEAQGFVDQVSRIENLLSKGIVDFKSTDRINIKRCVINRQISMFYRIQDSKSIELLRFWNNNQDFRNNNY